jgi:hypothetical protein
LYGRYERVDVGEPYYRSTTKFGKKHDIRIRLHHERRNEWTVEAHKRQPPHIFFRHQHDTNFNKLTPPMRKWRPAAAYDEGDSAFRLQKKPCTAEGKWDEHSMIPIHDEL